VKWEFISGIANAGCLLQILTCIEVAELSKRDGRRRGDRPPGKSTSARHPDRVEQVAFRKMKRKDFLHQVVRLGFVPKYPLGYVAHGAAWRRKRNQCLFCSLLNLFQQ